MVAIPETKVLRESGEGLRVFLAIGFDDKARVSRSSLVLLGLSLDKTSHGDSIIVARLPLLVDLITGAGEVVIRVTQWHLLLVRSSADLESFAIYSPVGIGIIVAVLGVSQVVDVCVEVPVSGNVVEGVVLLHQVHDVLDLAAQISETGYQ